MFGVIDFYNAATEAGVKPIIGMEAYMAARGMKDRDSKLDRSSYHLLLLAENMTGYQNLLKIASAAQLEGFYYYPRIDHDFLAAHSEGLICTSGCMSAEIPRALLKENPEEAVRRMNWYYDVFGKERFFVELQHHNIKEITNSIKTCSILAHATKPIMSPPTMCTTSTSPIRSCRMCCSPSRPTRCSATKTA